MKGYYLNKKFDQPLNFAEEYARLEKWSVRDGRICPGDMLDFDQDVVVPEMHDRIIVGLARRLGTACISRDPLIVNSGLVPLVAPCSLVRLTQAGHVQHT